MLLSDHIEPVHSPVAIVQTISPEMVVGSSANSVYAPNHVARFGSPAGHPCEQRHLFDRGDKVIAFNVVVNSMLTEVAGDMDDAQQTHPHWCQKFDEVVGGQCLLPDSFSELTFRELLALADDAPSRSLRGVVLFVAAYLK